MIKASVKLELFKQKTYKNGNHPVVLFYRIDGKRIKRTITDVHPSDWDAKNNRVKARVRNSAFINDFLSEAISKAEKEIFAVKQGTMPLADLFPKHDSTTLLDCLDQELIRLEKESKSGSYDKILGLKKQLDTSIPIAQMDEKWFEKFVSDQQEKGNVGNTIRRKIIRIRGIIARYSNVPISKEVAAVSVVVNKPLKQKLSEKELAKLAELHLPEGSLLDITRDIFMMQIYLRGIRIGDLLQGQVLQFASDRFTYSADKTGKDQGIKLIPQAKVILEKYKPGKRITDQLFPIFNWVEDPKLTDFKNKRARLKHKEVCTAIVNANLKVLATMAGITKPLSSHIARHTFARMAIDKINNPMITMDLLGHTSLEVHQGYLNELRKEDILDKAADDIFSKK